MAYTGTVDTALYAGTGLLTVTWSVWAYLSWADHAGLPEGSGARFLLILGPSSTFLLLALAGWQRAGLLRLDLVGIVAFDVLTLAVWLALLLCRWLRIREYRKLYTFALVLYNGAALALILLAYLIKLFPPLLIRFTGLMRQLSRLDFFHFAWIGLDPQTHERDLVAMLNRVLIALLSYLPVALIRAAYLSRQRRKMAEDLESLKTRLEKLEKIATTPDLGEGKTP